MSRTSLTLKELDYILMSIDNFECKENGKLYKKLDDIHTKISMLINDYKFVCNNNLNIKDYNIKKENMNFCLEFTEEAIKEAYNKSSQLELDFGNSEEN